ncbi:MAG: hypothetical protein U5P41_07235 [Gammaproteobacteria bacterium]|nr:hypothetical protein [Gammaproteobacteria bacterium]
MELKALCIGLPKTGTTTLYKALCSAGLHAVRRHQPGKPAAGYIMHRNLLHGRPLLHGMETVEAVTQPDTCLHGMNVWPQMDADFLCRVRAEFPRCTFILQARDTELTLASIRAHGDLRERIVYAPGLYGAATTDNDIRAWIGRHYDSALEVIATLGGVTFDIASPEAPAALMQAMDIDIGWWGRANARA